VILSGGGVVGFCGVGFIVEEANGFAFTIIGYLNTPFLCSFLEAHPFVFRGWILSEVYPVVAVLPVCGRTEVRFAIVEAVMIDVIDV
jgi:hypothetical protein